MTPSRLVRNRRLALGLGALCLAATVASQPIRTSLLGLEPGDVTLATHFLWAALANLGFAFALRGAGWKGIGLWLQLMSFPLLFVPGYPAMLAPIGLVPWYTAILGARDSREAALIGGAAGSSVVLGSAGWIFHYFRDPVIPAAIALAIMGSLGLVIALATRALVRRSLLWVPLAAAFVPWSEVARGEWLNPPLPGLLLAHANADTALIRLAPWLHEAGIGYLVALLGIAGAVLFGARLPRVPAAAKAAALVLVGWGLASVGPTPDSEPAASRLVRVCSVRDPLRAAGKEAFGGGGSVAVLLLAERARELGCRLVAFPEYSLRLEPHQLVAPDWGLEALETQMLTIAGASVLQASRDETLLRNVVCGLRLGEARQINCAGAFDKLVFAPFGEVGLFQDVPALARLGARISRQATGAKFTRLVSTQPRGLLPLGGGRHAGVAICWEILIPRVFERRGVPGRGSVELLVVVSDLDGFGGSTAAIEQFRRAASLHAVRLGAPLLFAATAGPFLVSPNGAVVKPVSADSFITVWEIDLARS